MKRLLAAFIFAVALAAPAAAQDAASEETKAWPVKFGGKRTTGSGGYKGRSGYVQVGSEWRLRAGFSDYTFDGTTTTTRTGSLRASYQGEHLSLGVNVSVTPRAEEYRNRAWGVEGGWVFLPEDEGGALEEWELNGWWSQTRHHQSVLATPALPVQRELIINQHDLGVGASVTAWKATLSADAYASLYDQDYFDDLNAAARRRPRLSAAVSLVNGFPRNGGSARLDYEVAKWLTPFVSYGVTTYRVADQPPSYVVGGGASLRWGVASVDVSYEKVRQRGVDDTAYLGLGGSLRF